MSRRFIVRAAIAAACLSGVFATAHADDALVIDADALNGCYGQYVCALAGADVTTTGGTLQKKELYGATGFGVSNLTAGEIDIGENLRVDFDQSRSIIGIRILFLFNGPEFSDRAEKARITADGTVYTLSTLNDADDASASWSGPETATVTKCGATTAAGTGCFVITDPFPGAVSRLDFGAVAGGAPFSGPGTNDSDYSIEFIDVGAEVVVDLGNCANPAGCAMASVGGVVAASFIIPNSAITAGSPLTTVIPVRLPDCRYIPQACLDLLPPAGDHAADDNAARQILINLGVIKPLDPSGPYKLNPAAQLLNVKPLLPPEVTTLFDGSGTPPKVLPALYISSRWRGQLVNGHWFDGLFFDTDTGLVFSETFEGLIDVSVLTGDELGCEPMSNLLEWDIITTVSETAKSVGGRFIDTPINVGCVNPTKVSGTRLSLYSVNLEGVDDTFAPTIKSFKAKVTENNDAVFARLVQSLWGDLGEVRSSYACKQADTLPSGGAAPLSKTVCNQLAKRWAIAAVKIHLCVHASFYPASSYRASVCGLARSAVDQFEAALPATATGPDVRNRVSELQSRVDVFQHVWDERFLNSQKPGGFCREWGSCPPSP